MTLSPVAFKLAVVCIVFFLGVSGGVVPLQYDTQHRILSLGNAFGGGVFLSAGLLHMLPDAMEGLELWADENLGGYPFALLLAGCGFLLTLLTEKVLVNSHDAIIVATAEDGHGHGHAHGQTPVKENAGAAYLPKPATPATPLLSSAARRKTVADLSAPRSVAKQPPAKSRHMSISFPDDNEVHVDCGSTSDSHRNLIHNTCEPNVVGCEHRVEYYNRLFGRGLLMGLELQRHLNHEAEAACTEATVRRLAAEMDDGNPSPGALHESLHDTLHGHGHDHTSPYEVDKVGFDIVPYLLLMVLCIHSVVAGLAVGLNNDGATVFVLFIAIAAHKFTAAIALGVSLVKSRVPRTRYALLVVLFSSSTPFGILLGTVLSAELGSSANLVAAFAQSVGAGTFIYISSVHIVNEEFAFEEDKRMKFLLFMMGFALMAAVAIVT